MIFHHLLPSCCPRWTIIIIFKWEATTIKTDLYSQISCDLFQWYWNMSSNLFTFNLFALTSPDVTKKCSRKRLNYAKSVDVPTFTVQAQRNCQYPIYFINMQIFQKSMECIIWGALWHQDPRGKASTMNTGDDVLILFLYHRYLWIAIMILITIFGGVLTMLVVRAFFEIPTLMTMDTPVLTNEVPFPSVTLCSASTIIDYKAIEFVNRM